MRPKLRHAFTAQDIQKFYYQIQYLYNDFLLPFSKNYTKIETINKIIIKKEPFHNWAKYLPGETLFKALVIMKICKNNQYNEFLNDYKYNIENAINNGNSRYLPYYKQLIKVTEYLEMDDYKKFL
jgi:hypothetical protein